MLVGTFCTALLFLAFVQVQAYPNYIRNVPNGGNVKFEGHEWRAIGHSRAFGSGPLNVFGEDFLRAGNMWTKELCEKDSDGDGRSNGEELQDMDCTWVMGQPDPGSKIFVTHPGIPDECFVAAPAPAPGGKRIAILGSGSLGTALSQALSQQPQGIQIKMVSTTSEISVQDAVEWADIVFFAVPASAVIDIVRAVPDWKNKVVVDCINPFRWDKGPVWNPPPQGSVSAQLVSLNVTRVVKAFNTVGAEHLRADSEVQLFLAGDDVPAKREVKALIQRMKFQLDPIDLGPLRNAALLENLGVLWIHLATVGGEGRDFALNLVPLL